MNGALVDLGFLRSAIWIHLNGLGFGEMLRSDGGYGNTEYSYMIELGESQTIQRGGKQF